MEVSTLTQKAEQLHELRRQIARLDEIHEQETEPLIADMNTGGVKSLKVSTGETFTKAVRQSVPSSTSSSLSNG